MTTELDNYIEDELKKFDEEIDQTSSHVLQLDESIDIIYHYCSARTCLSIIENKNIWACDYLQMNDPRELRYGLDTVLELASRSPLAGQGSIRDFWKRWARGTNVVMKESLFLLTSFSIDKDFLPLWQNYADDGRGFAVGIDAKFLARPLVQIPNALQGVHSTKYDHSALQKEQKRIVDGVERLLTNKSIARLIGNNMAKQSEFRRRLSVRSASDAIWNSMQYKHPAYAYEREVRAAIFVGQNHLAQMSTLKVHARNHDLVRYCEIPLTTPDGQSAIREVVAGPASTDFSRRALQTLFAKQNLKIAMEESTSPYRSFRP